MKFKETKATAASINQRKPLYGLGINDAWYRTHCISNDGSRSVCPYYKIWAHMIERCNSKNLQAKYPTYSKCSVSEIWIKFSNFKLWMEKQDWQGRHLDKDLLIPGNKVYSPESCIFVSGAINNLLTNSIIPRGDYPVGVTYNKRDGVYQSACRVNGKKRHLGCFSTPKEAEYAYCIFKSKLVTKIASQSEAMSDTRLHFALIGQAKLILNRVLNYEVV